MNTMQVMNKSHDMSPIISAIERREERIKRMMGATDPFELAQMIGNRATASETATVASTVSQRMNNPLANIEEGMSELVQKMFAMYIIYDDEDEITFPNNGATTTVSKKDMLGRSVIRARLKSQIKIQQQEQSRNALVLLQTLLNANEVNQQQLIATLVPLISQGTVNRRQAESFITQEQLTPELVEQIRSALPQQELPALDESAVAGMSPNEIAMMSEAVMGATSGYQPDGLGYQMAQATTPTPDYGYDTNMAGIVNNEANQTVQ